MSPSLFEASGTPVLAEAVNWLTGTLLGSVATGLCVVAVAVIGFTMLSGRLPIREGIRVMIGCFVLLGAPLIVAGFQTFAGGAELAAPTAAPILSSAPQQTPRELPPSDYDPYAGASLRDDRSR